MGLKDRIASAPRDGASTADRLTFFRMMAGEVARKFGAVATFMPKPFAGRTGSGAHLHYHLADAESGRNVFLDESDRRLTGHTGAVEAVAFAPGGTVFATGAEDGTVRLWDPRTGKELARFNAHVGCCWWLDFAPDGKHVVSGGGGGWTDGKPDPGTDFAIRVWTVEE